MPNAAAYLVINVGFIHAIQLTAAITCYVYESESLITKQTSSTWEYCGYAPAFTDGRVTDGRGWGILSSKDLPAAHFSPLFEVVEGEEVEFMADCVDETDNASEYSPKFAASTAQPLPASMPLRCVCNYDRCNTRASFQNFFLESDI